MARENHRGPRTSPGASVWKGDSGWRMEAASMTSDEYLAQILDKYRVDDAAAKSEANRIYPTVEAWAGSYLEEATFSGSIAKQTNIRLATDADVFVSLSPSTPGSLKDIYESLHGALTSAGYACRRRNVSIRVRAPNTYDIDIVPARRQAQRGGDHSLYRRRDDTWMQTNVNVHTNAITSSGRNGEIRLTKIWRSLRALDFASFYLELATIDTLRYARSRLSDNFFAVLQFLAGDFRNRRYIDPANSNNVVSDDLDAAGKRAVQVAAQESIEKRTWQEIVW
jgi:SMODS domain-containing protein